MTVPVSSSTPSNRSQNSSTFDFDQKLGIAKSSRLLADFMNQKGQSAITTDGLKQLANNSSGSVPPEVSKAASYMLDHAEVYQDIETHDVKGADGLSGVWNFEWAAKGGLDGTATAINAEMSDMFDQAAAKQFEITKHSTEGNLALTASKAKPNV